MRQLNRRSFLEHTLWVAAAGLADARRASADEPKGRSAASRPTSVPVNERTGVAIIGLHGRGLEHLDSYSFDDRVEIVALCDVDSRTFASAQVKLRERGRRPAKQYADIRQLLDDKRVDAVSIAMPNHWHALAGIWAMQAGKDAYVEKPVSHNVSEGRRLEQTRVKYKRICQVGTQARSSAAHQKAIGYVHEGHIGKVLLARGLCYKLRNSIGRLPDGSVPDGVDYDLWLGPAPKRPFNPNRFHYNWHWNWDYGNGDIGNQGIHQMDVARWGLQTDLPTSVISLGGRFGYEDDGQTPNTQLAIFDYGNLHLLFEVRGLQTPPLQDLSVGTIIYGSEGFVAIANEDIGSAIAFDNTGHIVQPFKGSGNHFNNFISAVRSRQQSDLHAPILQGHLSSALCHLANISYRLGEPHPFAAPASALGDNLDLREAFGRFEQHLADSKLRLTELSYRLGPTLAFDPTAENFGAHAIANVLLTREYRSPFVMPAADTI